MLFGGVQPLSTQPGGLVCLTGVVVPAPQIGIPFRGNFLLRGLFGQTLASLTGNNPAVRALQGQLASVCGLSEGEVEGVLSVRVLSALPVGLVLPRVPFGFSRPPLFPCGLHPLLLLLSGQGG